MVRRPVVVSSLLCAVLVTTGLPLRNAHRVSAEQQSSANMMVSATVVRKCMVTTTPLNFGLYDPMLIHATAPLDGQSTITVACTKGTAVSIGIDDGVYNRGNSRRMYNNDGTYLNYELYKDQNRSQRWGDNFGARYDGGVAPSRDPRDFTVYGRVAPGQDVDAAAFMDMVVVTVHF